MRPYLPPTVAQVSTDDVEEEIMKNEDLVQSVDIVAFVKV